MVLKDALFDFPLIRL